MSFGEEVRRIKVYFLDQIGVSDGYFEGFNVVVLFYLKYISVIREQLIGITRG